MQQLRVGGGSTHSSEALTIGDQICLFSDEVSGFIFSMQSSSVFAELVVKPKQNRERPSVVDSNVMAFEICIANRYKFNKKYRKLLEKASSNPDDIVLQNSLKQAMSRAQAENEDNITEQKRQQGRTVVYGQVIQLRHIFTGKFVHVSTMKTSELEYINMQILLQDFNAKHAQFRVLPRYKVKAEGDIVQMEDQIVLESIKTPGQYIHVSGVTLPSSAVYALCHEVNLSVRPSGFSIIHRSTPRKESENVLTTVKIPFVTAGSAVQFFHRELEGYLVAEGRFPNLITEDVHLRLRPLDTRNRKSFFASTSAITYWQIEMESGPIKGGIIKWEQPCRLRHMVTRQFLIISDSKIGLTEDHSDAKAIFRLHPVVKVHDEISGDSYCRIQHVMSGCWIQALADDYKSTSADKDITDGVSMESLKFSKAVLKKVAVSKEMHYDDAFTIQLVEASDVANFRFFAGMVPFLQTLISDVKGKNFPSNKQTENVVQALDEMEYALITSEQSRKKRQKLLRNLKIVELIVQLLHQPSQNNNYNGLQPIIIKCYDVLVAYLDGDSRKNELYMARHFRFFEKQIIFEGDIGLCAVNMVTELARDNRQILDRISREHINNYISLLQKNMNYRYLELLCVLCYCDGVAMSDNQNHITNAWLTEGDRSGIYHMELGQNIGRINNILYLSTDNKKSWTGISDFVTQFAAEEDQEEFKFLEYQLEAFYKLCYGNNTYARRYISEVLGYLTWEKAFLSLVNEQLPDKLRAKYCKLLAALFVDADSSENSSVILTETVTFIYDEIGDPIVKKQLVKKENSSQSTVTKNFPILRDWIINFLRGNCEMATSLVGRNILIEQVLHLLYKLVSCGHCCAPSEVRDIWGPLLLNLINGKTDVLYKKSSDSQEAMILQESYLLEGRFKDNPETRALLDAKYQALKILDLYLGSTLIVRQEHFMLDFKRTTMDVNASYITDLKPLLHESYDIEESISTNNAALKRLQQIFNETELFDEAHLMDILMDLSNYEYDKIVVQCLHLINRFYSGHERLFKKALQSQILVKEKSIQVLTEVQHIMKEIQTLAMAKMTEQQCKHEAALLDKLTNWCHLDNNPSERHAINQSIIYNHDILHIIFDKLSQKIDVALVDQYAGFMLILRKALVLLRALARDNTVVQQRIFDRLDELLEVQGVEDEIASALVEAFQGNINNCMKIMPYQIQKIMSLAAELQSKAPNLLNLLQTIISVDSNCMPLKRNQSYVMKYLMQCRTEVAAVLNRTGDERQRILVGPEGPELVYLLSLVDLLASCAKGENEFINSICQTMFSTDELLAILNDNKVWESRKKPFVHFFHHVYLYSTVGSVTQRVDLAHSSAVWAFINNMKADCIFTTRFAVHCPETVRQLLRKKPDSSRDSSTYIVDNVLEDPDRLETFLSESGRRDIDVDHRALYYFLEGVLPFLQDFFGIHYQPDRELYSNEADKVDELARALLDFANTVGPLVSNQSQAKKIFSCTSVVLTSSTLPVKVMEDFQQKFGFRAKMMNVPSEALKKYNDYYDEEIELNSKLHIFSSNYRKIYCGKNTVQAQTGYPSNHEYISVGSDEELPLGQEFQQHLQSFIRRDVTSPADMYCRAGKLIEQLMISSQIENRSEKERLEQEELDIKCLQLLRGLVHNEIVKLNDDWENDIKSCQKQLKRIADVQNVLGDMEAMKKVLPIMARTGDDIVREVLAFLAAILFNGNEYVQLKMLNYFLGTREEKFFLAVKKRLQMSAVAVKERRLLRAQHVAKLKEAVEQSRALFKAIQDGRLATEVKKVITLNILTIGVVQNSSLMPNGIRPEGYRMPAEGLGNSPEKRRLATLAASRSLTPGHDLASRRPSAVSMVREVSRLRILENESKPAEKEDMSTARNVLVTIKENKVTPINGHVDSTSNMELQKMSDVDSTRSSLLSLESLSMELKDDGYALLILKILGLICDGQNKVLQDYMRIQPDNIKSLNIVSETATFFGILYTGINHETVGLTTELLSTLVEFASGNLQNQTVIFECKACDYINFILRNKQYQDCSPEEELELKDEIATLIVSLIEENIPIHEDVMNDHVHKVVNIAKEVAECLDTEAIWNVCVDYYVKSEKDVLIKSKNNLLADSMIETGFKYFHILLRIFDLCKDSKQFQDRMLTAERLTPAWNYYESGTKAIEILKDDTLQKIYFWCKDQSILREDVKEKFKYSVDRSSPSNKLREFMEWSHDIIHDIKHTKHVLNNPVLGFFTKYSVGFSIAMMLLSCAFFVLFMVTWDQPRHHDGSPDNHSYIPSYLVCQSCVEDVTIIMGIIHNIATLCVMLSYFITYHPQLPQLRMWWRRKSETEDGEESESARQSHLQINVLSFKTFWFLLLMVTSILGTFSYGYFFSFHLLHMAEYNQLIKRAIHAVTRNGGSLIWIFIYGLILIYIYTLLAFAFYRDYYDPVIGKFCGTFYECMATTVRQGLIGGVFEIMKPPPNVDFVHHLWKNIYDISYFIIITVIGLNVIFGIIVDTFSELRDSKWQADHDMKSTCFICSRSSYEFEHHGGGFERHVKTEHHLWDYLFFFIHLDETRPNDYMALELYVHRMMNKHSFDFFPLNRALSLQRRREDDGEHRMETLMAQVQMLVDRMKSEDAVKEQESERNHQHNWELRYKGANVKSLKHSDTPIGDDPL